MKDTTNTTKKNTIISIIVSIVIIGVTFYFISSNLASNNSATEESSFQKSQNVEIRDGVQYVSITAKNGYSPRTSFVDPDIPTKLIVKTNRTYDCSASLIIRYINYEKTLNPTGEEIIDLGTLKKGEKIRGSCGMGMYYFEIRSS